MTAIRALAALGLFAATAFPSAPLRADPLEDDYLKARNAYIARFDAGDKEVDYKKVEAPLKRAEADLQNRLRKIVGKPDIRGASGEGKLNEMSLMKGDIEFGALDALVFGLDGGKSRAYVTTTGLLGAWLNEHRDWWDKGAPNVPQDAAAALAFDGFYTQALSHDAAVVKFAELAIKPPEGAAFAQGMLDRRQQDDGPGAPDEIIVSLVRGGRVYIVTAPATPKPPVIAVCEKVWKDYLKKADAAQERYQQSGLKDEAASKEGETLRSDGDRAFRACYGEKIKASPVHATLLARAQKLLDTLPR